MKSFASMLIIEFIPHLFEAKNVLKHVPYCPFTLGGMWVRSVGDSTGHSQKYPLLFHTDVKGTGSQGMIPNKSIIQVWQVDDIPEYHIRGHSKEVWVYLDSTPLPFPSRTSKQHSTWVLKCDWSPCNKVLKLTRFRACTFRKCKFAWCTGHPSWCQATVQHC